MIADAVGSLREGLADDGELGNIQSNVRRLFTSRYVDAGADVSLLTHTNGDFVDSPFTPRSLVCKVREVLDRNPC